MFVLYNAAHQHSRIKSFDGNAWIRVLGFFMTRESAILQANKISSSISGGLEIRIAPTEEFRLILNKNYSQPMSFDKEKRKHGFLLQFHKEYKEKNKLEVEENATKKQIGNIVFSPQERREYYNHLKHDTANDTNDDTKIDTKIDTISDSNVLPIFDISRDSDLQTFSKSWQIRCQNFFAMAVIPDYETLMLDSQDLDMWKIEYDRHETMLKNNALHVLLSKYPSFRAPKTPTFIPERNEQYSDLFIKKFTEDLKEKWMKEIWELCGESYSEMVMRVDEEMQKWLVLNPVPVAQEKEEPAIAFLTVGDTSDEIASYIKKNKEQSFIRDYDVACICMYEWVRVSTVKHPSIKKQYREEILSDIFKNRDEKQSELENIRKEHPTMKVVEVSA